MTDFVIHISGAAETEGEEQAATFEREQLAVARQAVERLAGVSTAEFYGDALGSFDLLAPAMPVKIRAGGSQ